MISGPLTPRTPAGLRHLVLTQTELLERGLRVAVEDVELSGGELGRIDALLRDAGGRAVLLLLSTGEPDMALVARLLDGATFLGRGGEALQKALPEADIRFDEPFRVMVVGHRLHPELVKQLRGLDLQDLHVCEMEPFRVGGVERVVVRWLVRPADASASTGFSVPAGLVPAAARTRCEKLLRTLERLDPRLQVEGDRFSRKVVQDGNVLCEIWVDGERLLAQIADRPVVAVHSDEQSLQVADAVLRRYLELDRQSVPEASVSQADSACPAGSPPTPPADPPAAAPPADKSARPLLAMESLRRSVAETRVSREEFSALGKSATEGEVPEQ